MVKPIETILNVIVAEVDMGNFQRNTNIAYPVVVVQLEKMVQKLIQNGLEGSVKVVLAEAIFINP